MKIQKQLIDEFSYLMQLESSKTRIINETHIKQPQYAEEKPREYKIPKEINPVYRYTTDGELVDKYLNTKQMAKKLSYREYYIRKAADEEKLFKGFFLTRRTYSKEEIIERFKPKEKPIKEKKIKPIKEKKIRKPKEKKEPYIQICSIYQYDENGNLVAMYDNCAIASRILGWNRNTIKVYSKEERYFKGFLLTRTQYSPQDAKERFQEALNTQQLSYIYKDGNLIDICTSLSEVKEIVGTSMSLKNIAYHKERHKPINDYYISNKPLCK